MDFKKIDQVLKFALAIAGRRDSERDRELGPIHLIKLVYLADLAYAERHQGQTFTGAPWRFYHYGPWTEEVWKRIEPSVIALGATERTFASAYRDDHRRWSIQDADQVEELSAQLDRVLPTEVTSAVARGVRLFGTDTSSLLHEVYRTRPMLGTKPGDMLRFELAVPSSQEEELSSNPAIPLSAKQQKKRKEALRALREQVQQKLREQHAQPLIPPPTPPAYDEEFQQGVQWLDSLAGSGPEPKEGQFHFSDEIWTAPGRGEPE